VRVAGFVKVRNEIIREGNLYRLLAQLEQLCDCGVICDDASTDGTKEAIDRWIDAQSDHAASELKDNLPWIPLHVEPKEQNFANEMTVKQEMLDVLHHFSSDLGWRPDWILWMDGDELFEQRAFDDGGGAWTAGVIRFRAWLDAMERETSVDVWAFHYTQLWRGLEWARVDDGFDDGWFWKLWRYSPELSFTTADGALHRAQFPQNFMDPIMRAVNRHGGSHGKAQRAPWEVLHLGNVGKNLIWKAIQYRNSGLLEPLSLKRHLYFGSRAQYRRVPEEILPGSVELLAMASMAEDTVGRSMVFTSDERALIERMGDMKKREGLFVVIVPTYNRGMLLDRTLQSVLDQSINDWVCVVLDDGSTDETPAVMKRWTNKDPRFFYCRYEENRGGVAMNEIGMRMSVEFGEFWVRLGSDDYFKSHKLELDRLAFNFGAAACYGPYRDLHGTDSERELRGLPTDARGALLSDGFAAGWANVAVRTSVLEKVLEVFGSFCDPAIRNMEDWPVNARIARIVEFAWRGFVPRERGADTGEFLFGLGQALESRNLLGEHDVDLLLHDAVWHIGADGASQKGDQCAKDTAVVVKQLVADNDRLRPAPRAEKKIVRARYTLQNKPVFTPAVGPADADPEELPKPAAYSEPRTLTYKQDDMLSAQRALIAQLIPHLKWRHHGIGALQAYVLEKGEPEMRIHIWHPRLVMPGKLSMHDHRFDMTSDVLLGEIDHVEMILTPDESGTYQKWAIMNARRAEEGKQINEALTLQPGRFNSRDVAYTIKAGESYHFPRRCFHRSAIRGLAVTLVTKWRQEDRYAYVLSPFGVDPVYGFDFDKTRVDTGSVLEEARTALLAAVLQSR